MTVAPNPCTESEWIKQDLTIPRSDGSLFAKPSLPKAVDDLQANFQRFQTLDDSKLSIQGRTLKHLRRWTRDRVLELATAHTRRLLGEAAVPEREHVTRDNATERPWIVTGHQPELYHPGVWVKNAAAALMAEQVNGIGLHLVIDNDTVPARTLRVPQGDRVRPTIDRLPFDEAMTSPPWEEATVQDAERFRSFLQHTTRDAMAAWNIEPVLSSVGEEIADRLDETRDLVTLFSLLRMQLEQRFGFGNLELPLSQLCETEPFQWFAAHLLAHLPRFQEVYNGVLSDYREVNGIRSETHPVPPLMTQGEWLEAPFWVWSEGEPTRERVFARSANRTVELTSDPTKSPFVTLPLDEGMEACCAVEELQKLRERGIRFRTRALTTTLFARLCLADSFIHGIGGAKYDEMADRLMQRFFCVEPPKFLTLSATAYLPIAEPFDVTEADEQRLVRQQRELDFNADRFLDSQSSEETQRLIDRKRHLIAEQQRADSRTGLSRRERRSFRRENYERFRAFQQVNTELATLVATQREQLRDEWETTRRQLAANEVLTDREFSFALYPEDRLRSLFEQVHNALSEP